MPRAQEAPIGSLQPERGRKEEDAGESKAAASIALPPASGGTLFYNGRIHIGEWTQRPVEALLVADGRVQELGATARFEADPAYESWRRVDLKGATVVPGLQDAHVDLESLCERLDAIDLSKAESYADLIARVQLAAEDVRPGTWIRGYGWDSSHWPDAAFPHHQKLSEKVPDHPVFLEHAEGAVALVNAQALRKAGLDQEVLVDKKLAGRVLADEERRATGILVDRAVDLVAAHLPEMRSADLRRNLQKVQNLFLRQGVTCVHDMNTSRRFLQVLAEMRDSNLLSLRVVCYLDAAEGVEPKEIAQQAELSGGMLEVAGVSLVLDGSLFTRGAALVGDYSDAPGERGHLFLDEAQLGDQLTEIAKAGLQPAVHAVGDRANRIVLDTYKGLIEAIPGFASLRPRIEQARVVSTQDWPRFAKLGVIASMQPLHSTADARWILERLGEDRTAAANDWRGLTADMGPGAACKLAFGSGSPIRTLEPMANFHAALIRGAVAPLAAPKTERSDGTGATAPDATGAQAPVSASEASALGDAPADLGLSARAVLTAFTRGAALATREEHERGALAPGFWADLTVLDVDVLAARPEEIARARCVMTVVGGRIHSLRK